MVRNKTLSPEEVKQRVDILKRFRELLKAQRDRFQAYLDSLDKQKESIESGSADDLIRHVELEEKIIADIFSIQKVIDPMEDMYKATLMIDPADVIASHEDNLVSDLKSSLEELKSEAVVRSERNKNLLSKRMSEIRAEIKTIHANPYARKPAHSGSGIPSLIDLKG